MFVKRVFYVSVITMLFLSCKAEKDEEIYLMKDFPWERTIKCINNDIASQLNCECVELIYNEPMLNEQRMLLLLGGFASYYSQKDSTMNLVDKKYIFLKPPVMAFEQTEKKCEKVEMTKVTISTDESIFLTELKVVRTKELYIFLALKDKKSKWNVEVSGALNSR